MKNTTRKGFLKSFAAALISLPVAAKVLGEAKTPPIEFNPGKASLKPSDYSGGMKIVGYKTTDFETVEKLRAANKVLNGDDVKKFHVQWNHKMDEMVLNAMNGTQRLTPPSF